jgi:hypothetical protein
MKLTDIPFTVTDWERVPRSEHAGTQGTSFWRTIEAGGLRVRKVDYTPGFVADHFCPRGHVLLVLDGEIVIRLKDGAEHTLSAGLSFQAGDDETNPHQVLSPKGARVFIVD